MKQLDSLSSTSSLSSSSFPSAGEAFFHQFVPISFARPGITPPSPSASAASVRPLSPTSALFHAQPLSQPLPAFTTAGAAASDGLPQSKTHRLFSSSPVLVAAKVKPEAETESSTEAIGDDANALFNAYMNLVFFDALNTSGTEEKPKESNKSGAATANHFRSLSMDSLIGQLQDTMTNDTSSSEFNSAAMKKILANEKLAEMAETDPKRVKRILANRQAAARSKEKKLRYISELENKVQALQTEATILSEQLNSLQRGIIALKCQNNELRICLEGMEHQAKLRDAINEALNAEVQRLKIADKCG